jgi:K+/H+ antiporter YhaU regulatory subunit KhtT
MTFELFGRIHKELSITGSAFHEMVLAISERVNRKVQIIRLHWQASSLLQRIDEQTGDVGRQIVTHVSRRFLIHGQSTPDLTDLDTALSHAAARVHEFKRSLLQIDGQIRELKLEAIYEDLLRLHHDLKLRSARIDRLTVARTAGAVGQPIGAMPQPSPVHVAAILRGPFVLAPSDALTFRPDDIVILIGTESDLDHLAHWFTSQRLLQSSSTKSA